MVFLLCNCQFHHFAEEISKGMARSSRRNAGAGKRKSPSRAGGTIPDLFKQRTRGAKLPRKSDVEDVASAKTTTDAKRKEQLDIVVVEKNKDKQVENQKEQPEEEDLQAEIEKLPYRKALKADELADEKDPSVPYATFLTVHYESRGVSRDKLQTEYGRSPREIFNSRLANCKMAQYVMDNFHVPDDFDRSSKFGPRSGMCHEERVVLAFENGLLAPKDPSKPPEKICRECGHMGHFCFECPSLIE